MAAHKTTRGTTQVLPRMMSSGGFYSRSAIGSERCQMNKRGGRGPKLPKSVFTSLFKANILHDPSSPFHHMSDHIS